jgi:2-phosphosulfolactate phosphatase
MRVHLEWGAAGAHSLIASCDLLIVVDVLSFTTAVDIAVGRGAVVFPYWGARAAQLAARLDALLAVGRSRLSSENPHSLSPRTLLTLGPGDRLVLPSPNGSAISRAAARSKRIVLAGCLRNASAVAAAAQTAASTIGVVAAGERWPDGSLRPAFEDLVGAGAIISRLRPDAWSPEAGAAVAAFERASLDLPRQLLACSTGQELVRLGFADDVHIAAEVDASRSVPRLQAGAYRAARLQA